MLPKPRSKITVERSQPWIPGHDRSQIWPVRRRFHRLGLPRVEQHVIRAGDAERVPLPSFGRQDVIMRLMLKFRRPEERPELRTEKLDPVALVRFAADSHPDEMNMVGHEAISGANQALSRGGVQHNFAKRGVETVREPALSAVCNGHGPEYHGIRLIELALEARKVVREGRARLKFVPIARPEILGFHGGKLARTDVRGYSGVAAGMSRRKSHESARDGCDTLRDDVQINYRGALASLLDQIADQLDDAKFGIVRVEH